MNLRLIFLLLLGLPWLASCQPTGKTTSTPIIWVYSDMSDPRDQRKGGHPQNDPDDICSMASLLLSANRFDIRGIVVASTPRSGLTDPMPFVEEVFVAAYQHDLPQLQKAFGGFQANIPFQQSSLTMGGRSLKFDPNTDYADLSDLSTVQQLIDIANENEVYVLSWGPLTESAMAIKHCLDTGNEKALRNIFVISHWTKSSVSQGSPDAPFNVANCKDDRKACDYVHERALEDERIRFIELGCVGQTGIVNGMKNDAKAAEADFLVSELGQIFISSKFYFNKPDFSDAATHWLLTEGIGPGLEDYPHDGSLTQTQEEAMVKGFFDAGGAILEDLRSRSLAAADGETMSEALLASYFTYVYFNTFRQEYGLHLPFGTHITITNPAGQVMLDETFEKGNHKLDLSAYPVGRYQVKVANVERLFELVVEGG